MIYDLVDNEKIRCFLVSDSEKMTIFQKAVFQFQLFAVSDQKINLHDNLSLLKNLLRFLNQMLQLEFQVSQFAGLLKAPRIFSYNGS